MLRGVLLLLSTSHQAGKTHGASAAPFFTIPQTLPLPCSLSMACSPQKPGGAHS